jgi:hypothetical protein
MDRERGRQMQREIYIDIERETEMEGGRETERDRVVDLSLD